MRPAVGSIKRLIIRRVVVLPQPDGPISTTIDPSSMSRSRDVTAGVAAPSNCLETFLSLMAMAPIVLPFAGSCLFAPAVQVVGIQTDLAGLRASVGRSQNTAATSREHRADASRWPVASGLQV
jgi:hypothetical protein